MADLLDPEQAKPILVRMAEGDIRPRPDPTELTNRAVDAAEKRLERDIVKLQELVQAKLDLLSTRLDATIKYREDKFQDLTTRFSDIDKARIESKQDARVSIDLAFKEQREAVNKSEAAVEKQMTQIRVAGETGQTNLRRDIDTLKENTANSIRSLESRVTTVESQKQGEKSGAKENTTLIVAIVGGFVLMISVMTWLNRSAPVAPVVPVAPVAPVAPVVPVAPVAPVVISPNH